MSDIIMILLGCASLLAIGSVSYCSVVANSRIPTLSRVTASLTLFTVIFLGKAEVAGQFWSALLSSAELLLIADAFANGMRLRKGSGSNQDGARGNSWLEAMVVPVRFGIRWTWRW